MKSGARYACALVGRVQGVSYEWFNFMSPAFGRGREGLAVFAAVSGTSLAGASSTDLSVEGAAEVETLSRFEENVVYSTVLLKVFFTHQRRPATSGIDPYLGSSAFDRCSHSQFTRGMRRSSWQRREILSANA